MIAFFRKHGILALFTVISVIVLFAMAITGTAMSWGTAFTEVMVRSALPLHFKGFLNAPWTLITHPFFVPPTFFIALLFELLMLWNFGLTLRRTIGEEKLRALLLVSLFILPVIVFAICAPLPFMAKEDMLFGFDLGITAILAACMTLLPGLRVRLFFFIEIRLLWLGAAILFIGTIGGIISLTHYMFSIPLAAAFGWQYVVQLRKGRDLAGWIWYPFEMRQRIADRKYEKERQNKLAKARQTFKVVEDADSPEAEMNRILDKISAGGYNNLTRDEKEFLERYSRDQK